MPKPIIVKFEDKESSFAFKKLDRAKLYGKKRRVALGPDKEPCSKASLTEDGSILITSGMTSQGYFDQSNQWFPNKELVGLDENDSPVEKQASTLGVAQDLSGPVDASELLDLRVDAVYMLENDAVDDSLKTLLDDGKVFKFSFNYRGDYQAEEGFLVANKTGTYALVGRSAAPTWCELDVIPPPQVEDTTDEDDDELDFEMF